MKSISVDLISREQVRADLRALVFPFIESALVAGGCWVLSVKRKSRTPKQNNRYWGNGVLAQIAKQAVVNGVRYSADIWHEMFKRMFIGVVDLPDGSVIGMSSRNLSTVEFSDFCSKVEAYAASDLGVTFYDLSER